MLAILQTFKWSKKIYKFEFYNSYKKFMVIELLANNYATVNSFANGTSGIFKS